MRGFLSIVACIWLSLMQPSAARAQTAEPDILAVGAVQNVLMALAASYKATTGTDVTLAFSTAGGVRDRIIAGARPGLVITSTAAMSALAERGIVQSGDRQVLGVAGIGIAVRANSPDLDVSTPERLTTVLQAARRIAYADPAGGATSGIHMAKVFSSLGIADMVREKAVLVASGPAVVEAVLHDKADIGFSISSEIATTAGVKLAGTLPAPHNLDTAYELAPVQGAAKVNDDFRRFLTGPHARDALAKAGFTLSAR